MALLETIASIEAQLTAARTGAGQSAPAYATGWKSTLKAHVAPPRVVWYPLGGNTEQRGDQGGDGLAAPRKLGTRRFGLGVHVRADDIGALEQLLNQIVAACQVAIPGGFNVIGEDWDVGDGTEATADGELAVLAIELFLPWTREEEPTAVIEAMPTTATIEQV